MCSHSSVFAPFPATDSSLAFPTPGFLISSFTLPPSQTYFHQSNPLLECKNHTYPIGYYGHPLPVIHVLLFELGGNTFFTIGKQTNTSNESINI